MPQPQLHLTLLSCVRAQATVLGELGWAEAQGLTSCTRQHRKTRLLHILVPHSHSIHRQLDRQGAGSVPCFPWLLLLSQLGMTAPVHPSFCMQHLKRQWSHIHTSVPTWGCHCSRRWWHLGFTWHPQAHIHLHVQWHKHVHTPSYSHISLCTHTWIYTSMHAWMYRCVQLHTHTHTHVCTDIRCPQPTLSHLLSAAPSLSVPCHVPDPRGHQHPTRGHAPQKSSGAVWLGVGTE